MSRFRFGRQTLVGFVVGAHLANNVAMALIAPKLRELDALLFTYLALYGVAASQPVLLAMWAIFAQRPLRQRVVVTALAATLLIGPPWLVRGFTWEQLPWNGWVEYFGYQAFLFGLSGALFTLVQVRLDWRIVERGSRDALPPGERKLTLHDLFGLITYCAIGAAAIRSYATNTANIVWSVAWASVHSALALTLMPVCLAKRPHVYRWLAIALSAVVSLDVILAMTSHSFRLELLTRLAGLIGFFGSIAFSLKATHAAGFSLHRQRSLAGRDPAASIT